MFLERIYLHFLSPTKRAEYFKRKRIVKIGENCEVYNGVLFGSEPYLITIGNDVRIAKGVKFITHDGGMWVIRNLMGEGHKNVDKVGRIKVGNNVFIGMDSTILQDVTIGNNVVVGCNSIVTKDIPDNSVVAGVPAKVICSIEEYYNKNKNRIYDTKHLSYEEKKKFYENMKRED